MTTLLLQTGEMSKTKAAEPNLQYVARGWLVDMAESGDGK
jgi:hypothetical protein